MYSKEKILEILEAYDLTKSLRSAAALVGCGHHTVARYVAARAAGLDPSAGAGRPTVSEPFVDKIHEWVDRSDGRIRANTFAPSSTNNSPPDASKPRSTALVSRSAQTVLGGVPDLV